jgi:hypothetical protein
LFHQDVERSDARRRHRRGMRGGKQEGPRPVAQEVNQRPAACDISANRPDRL